MTTDAGWVPIKSAYEEWGASYRGHHLDLMLFEGRWLWSATHSPACPGHSRGSQGVATGREVAERAALAAVDAYGCAAKVTL